MSSFVIGKKEYMKTAGFIAGLAEADPRNGEHVIYLWNFNAGRVYTLEDFKKDFTQCYVNNAISVQKQYHDSQPESDENAYEAEFRAYYSKGKNLYREFMYGNTKPLETAVFEFQQFADSVNYQIEDERLNFLTMHFLNEITTKLVHVLASRSELSSWSEFSIA